MLIQPAAIYKENASPGSDYTAESGSDADGDEEYTAYTAAAATNSHKRARIHSNQNTPSTSAAKQRAMSPHRYSNSDSSKPLQSIDPNTTTSPGTSPVRQPAKTHNSNKNAKVAKGREAISDEYAPPAAGQSESVASSQAQPVVRSSYGAGSDVTKSRFLFSLYELLGETANHHAMHWNKAGDEIVIQDPVKVEKILPKYFGHAQILSLNRQLNLYGFGRPHAHDPAIPTHLRSFIWRHPTLNAKSTPKDLSEIKRNAAPKPGNKKHNNNNSDSSANSNSAPAGSGKNKSPSKDRYSLYDNLGARGGGGGAAAGTNGKTSATSVQSRSGGKNKLNRPRLVRSASAQPSTSHRALGLEEEGPGSGSSAPFVPLHERKLDPWAGDPISSPSDGSSGSDVKSSSALHDIHSKPGLAAVGTLPQGNGWAFNSTSFSRGPLAHQTPLRMPVLHPLSSDVRPFHPSGNMAQTHQNFTPLLQGHPMYMGMGSMSQSLNQGLNQGMNQGMNSGLGHGYQPSNFGYSLYNTGTGMPINTPGSLGPSLNYTLTGGPPQTADLRRRMHSRDGSISYKELNFKDPMQAASHYMGAQMPPGGLPQNAAAPAFSPYAPHAAVAAASASWHRPLGTADTPSPGRVLPNLFSPTNTMYRPPDAGTRQTSPHPEIEPALMSTMALGEGEEQELFTWQSGN